MDILIISSSNPNKASGIVAKDLLNGLSLKNENRVKLIVKAWDKYGDTRIDAIETKPEHYCNVALRLIKRVLKKIFKNNTTKKEIIYKNIDSNYYFEYDLTKTYYSTKKVLKKTGYKPDIVIILFMTDFLSFKNLHEINKLTGAKIYLYLMDMAPFTGGCHYAWKCKGYEKQCGKCPAIYSEQAKDQSFLNWEFKNKYIEKTNISAIAAADWTYQQLMKSTLFKNKQKQKILLPIDSNVFNPDNKTTARNKLGLPLNKRIVFLGAVTLHEKRKGFRELIIALNILKEKLPFNERNNIHLAIAGKNSKKLTNQLTFSYTLLGFLSHKELPIAFQASDIFVTPSIEDSGPMMINQSIMCGTPVVAYEMGVALDLVHTGETGYRAKLKDSKDLAAGIKFILELNDLEYKKMSAKCRETGLLLCYPEQKAKEWMNLFTNQLQQ